MERELVISPDSKYTKFAVDVYFCKPINPFEDLQTLQRKASEALSFLSMRPQSSISAYIESCEILGAVDHDVIYFEQQFDVRYCELQSAMSTSVWDIIENNYNFSITEINEMPKYTEEFKLCRTSALKQKKNEMYILLSNSFMYKISFESSAKFKHTSVNFTDMADVYERLLTHLMTTINGKICLVKISYI